MTKIKCIALMMRAAALATPNEATCQRITGGGGSYEVWLCYRSSPEGAAWHLGIFSDSSPVTDRVAGHLTEVFFEAKCRELMFTDVMLAGYPENVREMVKSGRKRQFTSAT